MTFDLKSWLREALGTIPNDVSDADIKAATDEVLKEMARELEERRAIRADR